MTNDELEKLTTLAGEAHALLPEFVLDGHGHFRTLDGEHVQNGELLVRLTQARDRVEQLHNALKDTPRNKGRNKKNGDPS